MMREAIDGAPASCLLDPDDIEAIHVGNAFGELYRGQGHLAAMVAQVKPEFFGKPAMWHEAASASSSLGILSASAEIEAGRYDCIMVLGVEEESPARRPGLAGAERRVVAGPRRARLQVRLAGRVRQDRDGVRRALRPRSSLPEPHRRDQHGQGQAQSAGADPRLEVQRRDVHRRRRVQSHHRTGHASAGLWPDHRWLGRGGAGVGSLHATLRGAPRRKGE